jgi:hypothetical protein
MPIPAKKGTTFPVLGNQVARCGAEQNSAALGALDHISWLNRIRKSGERFMMDHKDVKYMGEVEEELQIAVLESIPPERRMRGIPPEERLQGIPPEEWLRGLPPEERLRGIPPEERLRGLGLTERLHGVSFEELVGNLSEEQRVQLRKLLERQSGN